MTGNSMMSVGELVARMRLEAAAGNTVQLGPTALRELLALHDEMLETLRTTRGNIRSLGPAGALDALPEDLPWMPYRPWLAAVEQAIDHAERI